MNQNPLEQELREKAWRRPLTAQEQAQLEALLAASPAARADWEADVALNAALARLPERPEPSNLTARILADIEREDLTTAQGRSKKTNFFGLGSWGWAPRLAVVVLVLAGGGYFFHRQQVVKDAHNLATVAAAAPVAPLTPEQLEDFDAILLLPPPMPGADMDLLAVMK